VNLGHECSPQPRGRSSQ